MSVGSRTNGGIRVVLKVNLLDPIRLLQLALRPFAWAGDALARVGIKYDNLKNRKQLLSED